MLKEPARIGWESWFRKIDLVTPRKLKGKELLMHTRGWWTVDPSLVADVVEIHGRLVVGEEGELMVECKTEARARDLQKDLAEQFNDQIFLAP